MNDCCGRQRVASKHKGFAVKIVLITAKGKEQSSLVSRQRVTSKHKGLAVKIVLITTKGKEKSSLVTFFQESNKKSNIKNYCFFPKGLKQKIKIAIMLI